MQQTILQPGPDDAGVKLTHEEFAHAACRPPFRYERVRGRLVVMSPPGDEHRLVSKPIRRELGLYWGLHRDIVDDVDGEGWVGTSEDDDRIPDICVYFVGETSGQRRPYRVPDLVFEFVSGSRADQERDDIAKREEYHAIGVREDVIVDRFKNQVLVLNSAEGDDEERVLPATSDCSTPLLPGLNIPLAECFPSQ